ncbi:Two-component hybrid sensor and regulator (modular protein) [Candidatus Terasakiella magnetica]|uniref:Autoinducer 2 sensor kinase/phosphatase LuxQ n=1 Tax=Candidatus Terasakiella magnetica TaxID=1867952 RepID=A0A1C3RJ47_9PROT|nr:PAS domain S-box protein [Candidatus Terasakiella magnetica]SCA57295.1 Two-component hybrid sensor and regulator (modular protein) [Candidatus Terasakiella magnetica]
MSEAKKGLHLSTFILALSFGGVLMVSTLFAISSYFSARDLIDHEIQQSFDFRHRIINFSLDEKLGRAASRLSAMSDSEQLIKAINSNEREAIEESLFSILQHEETQNLDVLMLSGENGVLLGDVSSPLSVINAKKEMLITQSSKAFQKWTLVQLNDAEQTNALLFSVPVIEAELGRVIGAIHSAIAISENFLFAKELKEASGVDQLLLLQDNHVLVHSFGPNPDEKTAAKIREISQISAGKTVQVNDHIAQRFNMGVKEENRAQLSVILLLRRDNVASLFDVYSKGGVYLIVGALLTALFIAYMVRRLIGSSTDHLIDYVADIKKHRHHARFTPGPVQEFNHIGGVVSEMVTTIHENERYLTNLIELANSPIIAWNGEGRITKFNRAAERIFGRTQTEVEGMAVQKVIAMIGLAEKDKDSVLDRSLKGAVIDNWEMAQNNPKSGQDYHMSWSISPVAFHQDNSVATILAQGLDLTQRKLAEEELHRVNEELELRVMHRTRAMEEEITERRHIEAELRQSEERFRDIAEASSDWFWEMGDDLRFTFMSERALKVTGFGPKDILGKTRMELVTPERMANEGEKWREHQALLERHEAFRVFEYTIVNTHGDERVFRISGKPIFDDTGKTFLGYRGSGRDVTDEYLRAQELRLAKEEAENASQAKSEFLSSMSHELRTPLNGILGFAQLLLMPRKTELDEGQKEFVNQILKAGQHLLDLINEILDLAKIEARKVQVSLEAVTPWRVMGDASDLLEGLSTEYGIEVINEITEDNAVQVEADYTRLKQILVNLGSNAIKYNKPNGQVRFSCEICTDENMLQFDVVDNGPGIHPDEIEELFTPFNRLNAEMSGVEGTGIGLTITHKLVGLMGGRMGVESELGKGSHFWFRIPIFQEDNLEEIERRRKPSMMPEKSILQLERDAKILYVEDNPNNSKLMEEALLPYGEISLEIIRTAEEGLEYLENANVDLIFLDINLPGMDGWQMMEVLRNQSETKNIPVVAVTAQAMHKDIERGKEAGFVDYLPKPFNINDLYKIIQTYTRAD